jgi:uncharacterized protein (DUF2345 family)
LTVKNDIAMHSTDGEIVIVAATKITLAVGGSSIVITKDKITVVAPEIFLNP